jgi:phage gp36-like protein
MAYSTLAEIETLIGVENLTQLSDLDNTGAVDATRVASAISRADGIIDSYLGQRRKVPLAFAPPQIAAMSAEWAVRILRSRCYKGQPITEDQDAEKIDREWLTSFAKGIVTLGIDPEPVAASKVIDKAAPRDSTRTTSLERLKGLI